MIAREHADKAPVAAAVDVSVVIVNYNVRYFLEQCLQSVRAASKELNVEVFVVDNASVDDSLEMLKRFPEVTVIANTENVGFAKANNQAIQSASGRYVLLLNPDTLVAEDTFTTCLAYADMHAEVGCIGARMIDGRGTFLPESKRGFPTAWVSFTKMSGLGRLAPTSNRLNGYYMGHLAEHATHSVDVLPGAFMWLRAAMLPQVGGGLDEDYFMYGEDIDLSYLVQQAGYQNVYLPQASIIHYKGESTRKRSFSYVHTFYKAMVIFSDKHVIGPSSWLHKLALQFAIYARAAFAVLVNVVVQLAFVLLDIALLALLLLAVKWGWAAYYFSNPGYFTDTFMQVSVPLYVATWIIGLLAFGAYDRPARLPAVAKGVLAGGLLVLVAYALLPTEFRTSRAIILLTTVLAVIVLPLARWLWSLLRPADVSYNVQATKRDRRLAIVGSKNESVRVLALLAQAGIAREYTGRIAPNSTEAEPDALADISHLDSILQAYQLDEVILCNADVSYADTIALIDELGHKAEFRTVAEGATAIVGSPSPNAPGQLYTVGIRYALALAPARRTKRTFDILLSLTILLLWPLALLVTSSTQLLVNAWRVLTGAATWVGYANGGNREGGLPKLRPCVLPQGHWLKQAAVVDVQRLNELYARYYRTSDDWRMVCKSWRQLSREPLAIHRIAPPRWPARHVRTVHYTDPHVQ